MEVYWSPDLLSNFISFQSIKGFFLSFFRLSQEGLFYLLDSIEGRLPCEKNGVYGDSSIDKRQLNRIIRCGYPVFLQTYPPDYKLNFIIFVKWPWSCFCRQGRKKMISSAKSSHLRWSVITSIHTSLFLRGFQDPGLFPCLTGSQGNEGGEMCFIRPFYNL